MEVNWQNRLELKNEDFIVHIEANFFPHEEVNLSIRLILENKRQILEWIGDYHSQYIEEITSKTGNYKKFPVFIDMFMTALKQESSSVYLELLTMEDLQLLRQQNTASFQSEVSNWEMQEKLYLILTYQVAYDKYINLYNGRVHYPLPLKMNFDKEYNRDVEILEQIQNLKKENQKLLKENELVKSDKQELSNEYQILKRENQRLLREIHELKHEQQQSAKDSLDKNIIYENLRLKKEIEALTSDRMAVETAFDMLRNETRREFHSIQHEFSRLANELSSNNNEQISYQLKRCYQLIEQLLDELKHEKMRNQHILTTKENELKKLNQEFKSFQLSSGKHSFSRSQQESRIPRHQPIKRSSSVESKRSYRQPSPSPNRLHETPKRSYRRDSVSPARSDSSRSSNFKRFDPTAYIREKEEKIERRRSQSRQRSSSVDSAASRRSFKPSPVHQCNVSKMILDTKQPPTRNKENYNPQKKKSIDNLKGTLKSLEVSDIEKRLDVLQNYFSRLKNQNY